MNAHLQRAQHLLSQSRYELAERELRAALAFQPNDAAAHSMLALCLYEQDRKAEAIDTSRQAIRLAPDFCFAHYVHGSLQLKSKNIKGARESAREALRLDSADPDYFALLASVELADGKGRVALEAADQGLAIDSEHADCLNIRAMALVKLGRKAEAGQTMDGALRKDPENALSHANQGWTYLHRNDPRKALEHFKESLRLDPQMEWARSGMLEALRARYVVYRTLLAYFLWMSRLSGRAQWLVIIALFLGYQFLRSAARTNPSMSHWIYIPIGLYLAFVILTWVGRPLFNVTLRLNRFGRMVLTDDERRGSTCVGMLLVALVALLVGCMVSGAPEVIVAAFACGVLLLVTGSVFNVPPGRERRIRWWWLGAAGAIACGLLLTIAAGINAFVIPLIFALVGLSVAFQLFINVRATSRRIAD